MLRSKEWTFLLYYCYFHRIMNNTCPSRGITCENKFKQILAVLRHHFGLIAVDLFFYFSFILPSGVVGTLKNSTFKTLCTTTERSGKWVLVSKWVLKKVSWKKHFIALVNIREADKNLIRRNSCGLTCPMDKQSLAKE